jgi:hypothetical protein
MHRTVDRNPRFTSGARGAVLASFSRFASNGVAAGVTRPHSPVVHRHEGSRSIIVEASGFGDLVLRVATVLEQFLQELQIVHPGAAIADRPDPVGVRLHPVRRREEIQLPRVSPVVFLDLRVVVMETVDGAIPSDRHGESLFHVPQDLQRFPRLHRTLTGNAPGGSQVVGQGFGGRQIVVLVHMAEVGRIHPDEGGVVDGEPDQGGLHENATLLASDGQVHHLPRRSEQLLRAVPPETVGQAVLVSREEGLIQGAHRIGTSERQERQVDPMQDDHGEKVDHVHRGVGGERVFVHDVGVGVSLGILLVSGKAILKFGQHGSQLRETRFDLPRSVFFIPAGGSVDERWWGGSSDRLTFDLRHRPISQCGPKP